METNDDICSICLEDIHKYNIKELSCGHKLHFKCFLSISMRKNFFIECPLCREINKNVEFPHSNPKQNLIEIMGVNKRCICLTNNNKKCKNTSKLMNYGMCHIHHKEYLNEEMYGVMCEFIHLILLQRGGILTKIFLFDMGKQIIMKFCNKDSTVADIFAKFYEFYSIILNSGETTIKEYKRFYNYYDLKMPDKKWIEKCKENYIFY